MAVDGEIGEGMAFSGADEIEYALDRKIITLHSKIKCRVKHFDENGKVFYKLAETTPGRVLLSNLLPEHPKVPFSTINKLLTKKEISGVIDTVYRYTGNKATVIFADHLMATGFKQAALAGISIGKNDMVIPASKGKHIATTLGQVEQFEKQYAEGLITSGEKYNKVVDAWSQCTDTVAREMMEGISTIGGEQKINSIYMMAHSGARGSAAQIKQLAGMRGLMAKPNGEIIETPIISNFKEGLSVLEYFNSTHGARKGLADTALKTANSGYLTRRLVDVSQDCVVTEQDCGTTKGIIAKAMVDGGNVIEPLKDIILGRTSTKDIKHPTENTIIIKAGEIIDEETVDALEAAGIEILMIRSVLTCETKGGVCATCYGRDLARGTAVNIGEAVGVIAAQSIGEPGTQLTMRTFHIGGAAQRSVEVSSAEASHDGKIEIANRNVVKDSKGNHVVMNIYNRIYSARLYSNTCSN
jgi:DNA-directed RNA polymerase subunit beta'